MLWQFNVKRLSPMHSIARKTRLRLKRTYFHHNLLTSYLLIWILFPSIFNFFLFEFLILGAQWPQATHRVKSKNRLVNFFCVARQHFVETRVCLLKGYLFEQRRNPTAVLPVSDWPKLSIVEYRDCPFLGIVSSFVYARVVSEKRY